MRRETLIVVALVVIIGLLSAALLWMRGTAPPPVAAASPARPNPDPPRQPEPVPTTAPDPNAPYRARVIHQLWAFEPDRVMYRHHGVMEALKDGRVGFVPTANPSEHGLQPTRVATSSNVQVRGYQQHRNYQGYPNLAPILEPTAELKSGRMLDYDLEIDLARVPFLHINAQSPNRLLSISFTPFPDRPETLYSFAIPDTSTQVACTDALPTRERRWPGWRVFDYDSTTWGQTTIHVAFDIGKATHPIPEGRKVFER